MPRQESGLPVLRRGVGGQAEGDVDLAEDGVVAALLREQEEFDEGSCCLKEGSVGPVMVALRSVIQRSITLATKISSHPEINREV